MITNKKNLSHIEMSLLSKFVHHLRLFVYFLSQYARIIPSKKYEQTSLTYFFQQLFSNNRNDQLSSSSIVAVFAKVNALPCTEIESSVGDGNRDADTAESGLGVCRHVVRTFESVLVVWTVFRHEAVEDGLHVEPYVGITVLVDGQSAAGVLAEDIDEPGLRQLWQLTDNVRGD